MRKHNPRPRSTVSNSTLRRQVGLMTTARVPTNSAKLMEKRRRQMLAGKLGNKAFIIAANACYDHYGRSSLIDLKTASDAAQQYILQGVPINDHNQEIQTNRLQDTPRPDPGEAIRLGSDSECDPSTHEGREAIAQGGECDGDTAAEQG
jgi:hypothetical protein